MPQPNDLSRSLTALDQDSPLVAVVEMSQSSWLVEAIIPGVERRPAKQLEANEGRLLALLHRWRDEAAKAGRTIERIAVAFEGGRDGDWLAPHGSSLWAEGSRLRAHGVEAHVIHATSIAVSREHRGVARASRIGLRPQPLEARGLDRADLIPAFARTDRAQPGQVVAQLGQGVRRQRHALGRVQLLEPLGRPAQTRLEPTDAQPGQACPWR